MKPSERLAEFLKPVARARFQLTQDPDVSIDTGAGLGSGIKFRVIVKKPGGLPHEDFGLTECHFSGAAMLAAAKAGREFYFDHNGRNHIVCYR